uniref:ADF-H domain-containing protein n=2 Tax=Amphimedon queenslandica TaxID=400682 RepID=A0A1X7TW42_AMPQE
MWIAPGAIVNYIGVVTVFPNIIQYNIDQLIGGSAHELSTIIYWNIAAYPVAEILGGFLLLFKTVTVNLISIIASGVALSLILVSHSLFKHKLENISLMKNPIKLIIRVLCYARKHKYPENRSALTYWEEEAPSRLDLGKDKYGGPFTEEEVEDVKTFFRMLPLYIAIFGFTCVVYSWRSRNSSGVALSLILVSHSLFKHKLENISLIKNPIKLIVRVLCYARKHKYPENRSALTYWEEEAPSRLDLGKDKYGGPFTEEEVEDVKTFFRMLPLYIAIFAFTTFYWIPHGNCVNKSQVHCMVFEDYGTYNISVVLLFFIYQFIIRGCFHNNSTNIFELSYSLILPTSFEFTVAQPPEYRRGMMVGFCRTWIHYFIVMCFHLSLILIAFVILARRYNVSIVSTKRRKREEQVRKATADFTIMSMGGTEVSPDVKATFDSIKNHHAKKWAFFEIDRSKRVVLTQSGERRDTKTREEDKKIFEEEVKAKLRDDQPLYILYDFQFTNKAGRFIQKVAFIPWVSKTARIKDQMSFSSAKDAVRKCFTGISIEYQFTDIGEVDYDTLADEVERKA